MRWKIFLIVSALFLYRGATALANDNIVIALPPGNKTESVWTDTMVTIVVARDIVARWSKNGNSLATYDYGVDRYNWTNLANSFGIQVEVVGDDSKLNFTAVNRTHSDFYQADGELVKYGLNLIVHGKV